MIDFNRNFLEVYQNTSKEKHHYDIYEDMRIILEAL